MICDVHRFTERTAPLHVRARDPAADQSAIATLQQDAFRQPQPATALWALLCGTHAHALYRTYIRSHLLKHGQ